MRRVLTRTSRALLESRSGILGLAGHKHVVLADEENPMAPDLSKARGAIHLLTVSHSKRVSEGIRVNCRCKRR